MQVEVKPQRALKAFAGRFRVQRGAAEGWKAGEDRFLTTDVFKWPQCGCSVWAASRGPKVESVWSRCCSKG